MLPVKPTDARWTNEQWEAIYLRDQNIIVSAGAGSGKTAVLTERVFQRIKEGINVNELLVVTFTKAAALEMKERIRMRIIKAVNDGDESLFSQLNLLETAQISTFDSFSMAILKKYGHLMNISNDIQIGDSVAFEQLKEELLDEFINEKHKDADPAFIDFVQRYTMRNGAPLRSMIFELTENLLQRPDFKAIVKSDLEAFHSPAFYDQLIQSLLTTVKTKLTHMHEICDIMIHQFNTPEVIDHVIAMQQSIPDLSRSYAYDDLRAMLFTHKFPKTYKTMFGIEEDADDDEGPEEQPEFNEYEVFDSYKKTLKSIIDDCKKLMYLSHDDQIQLMQSNYPYEKTLLSLTGEFIERFFTRQIQTQYFDYQSVAYLSLQLILNFPEVQNALRHMYQEILVDEYQDTSPLQDALIEGIANENLFIVGDIKQSIYRFRGADPTIFQNKYDIYRQQPNSTVIHLNANFRSRSEVIDDINHVFGMIFDDTFGGVNYRENHAMQFGLENYQNEEVFNQNYGMTFLKFPFSVHEMMHSEDASKNKKREVASFESQLIIKDIMEKKNAYQIYDKETQTLRPARYDDFIILVDRKTYFDEFRDAFQSYGIPLHIHKNDAFLSNNDVLVTVNLFKLLLALSDPQLCQTHFKHAFLSLAYSYLFEFTTDEIIDFYTKIDPFEPKPIFDLSIDTPFEGFFKVFKELLDRQEYMRLQDILSHFNQSFKLIENALKLEKIAAIEERLIHIFNQLKNFDKMRYTLQDLIHYYSYAVAHHDPNNWFFDIDIDFVQGTAVAKDKVNIMTIHKSKGLEFPVVYYPNNFAGWIRTQEGVRYSDQNGLLLKSYHDGFMETIAQRLENISDFRASLSERLRLMYVAFTRAREAMVIPYSWTEKMIPSTHQYDVESEKVFDAMRVEYSSNRDIIQSFIDQLKYKVKEVNIGDYLFKRRVNKPKRSEILNQEYSGDLRNYQVLPPPSLEIAYEVSSESPFVHPRHIKNMQLGTDIHELLKNLDFQASIPAQLKALKVDKKYQALIMGFFDQSIMDKVDSARVLKEIPFAYTHDGTRVRGIIDLILEYPDKVIIIDYKTQNLESERYENQVMRYVQYIHQKTQKPVSGYLYSLVDQKVKTIVESYQ